MDDSEQQGTCSNSFGSPLVKISLHFKYLVEGFLSKSLVYQWYRIQERNERFLFLFNKGERLNLRVIRVFL